MAGEQALVLYSDTQCYSVEERTMGPLVLNVSVSVRLLTADRGNGQAWARYSGCQCTQGRQAYRQTDRPTDRHMHMHTNKPVVKLAV